MNRKLLPTLFLTLASTGGQAQEWGAVAYDIDEAKSICESLPIDDLEGIWAYPDDKVTVLILRNPDESSMPLQKYSIKVVESEDCRLVPGDDLGTISATPEASVYDISIFTEKKNFDFSKQESCKATLSKNADALLLKQPKSKLRLRWNINFSRLLPQFWRIVRIGVSGINNNNESHNTGMIKIYPSYDGNGSSRRKPRYL